MRRKKLAIGAMTLMMAVIYTACGNGAETKSVEIDETADLTETAADEESNNAEVKDQVTAETEDKEVPSVAKSEEETVVEENQDNEQDTLGGAELNKIVEQYDEVLSNYDLECYFGYNKPDDGWKPDLGYDGRQQGKEQECLRCGDEVLYIEGFESKPVKMISVYNENGDMVEVQADTYEYQCRYNDAIRAFCKTGEWEEPERCQKPFHMGMRYCIDRKPAGKIDTPYGEGTLYSAVCEIISYKEYNEEGAYWEIDESVHQWYRSEGMLIEIGDYFVQVELSTDDWYVWEWEEGESGDRLLNIEYTGRLEELLPQIFEVK